MDASTFGKAAVRYENGLIVVCSFSLVDNEQEVTDEYSEVHCRDASCKIHEKKRNAFPFCSRDR